MAIWGMLNRKALVKRAGLEPATAPHIRFARPAFMPLHKRRVFASRGALGAAPALSLWAVRRRSPSCRSYYRSVFRPAFGGELPRFAAPCRAPPSVRRAVCAFSTPSPNRFHCTDCAGWDAPRFPRFRRSSEPRKCPPGAGARCRTAPAALADRRRAYRFMAVRPLPLSVSYARPCPKGAISTSFKCWLHHASAGVYFNLANSSISSDAVMRNTTAQRLFSLV